MLLCLLTVVSAASSHAMLVRVSDWLDVKNGNDKLIDHFDMWSFSQSANVNKERRPHYSIVVQTKHDSGWQTLLC